MTHLEELTAEIREKLSEKWRELILSDVMLYVLTELPGDQESNIYFLTHKWDLSKPYLRDQSPELISFLHSLIKK